MATPTTAGDRIRLTRCTDPHTLLQPGAEGLVTDVDHNGVVWVRWDDGHMLGLIPDEDAWEIADSQS